MAEEDEKKDEADKKEEVEKKEEAEKKEEGEKKDEPEKKEEPKPEKKEEVKPTRKELSKITVPSKGNVKDGPASLMSLLSGSATSATSMGMKRQSELEKLAKGPKYQNTYRLDSKKPFKPREVYKVIEEIVLREMADFQHYDGSVASKLIQSIAGEIRTAVKLFNYDRYKICVLVILGEKKLQGYQCAFRALWDQERDGWTTYFYQFGVIGLDTSGSVVVVKSLSVGGTYKHGSIPLKGAILTIFRDSY